MFSIIIPTLNSGKYLGDTLESIHSQSFQDYEVILVDSNSDDDTLRIAHEYQKRMRLQMYLMPKEGQIRAINYGLSLAKGDILTFLNSDDTYEPECLGRVAQEFATKQGLSWLYGAGKVINHSGIPTRSFVTQFKALWWRFCNKRVLSWFDFIVQPTVFWRKELNLRFNPEFPLAFDYEAWLRLWQISNPVFVNQHLANWRAHSDSLSVRNTNKQIEESLRINLPYAKSLGDIVIQNLVAWAEKVVYGVIS